MRFIEFHLLLGSFTILTPYLSTYLGLFRSSTSVVQWYPSDNAVFVSSGYDGQLKVWDANHLNQPVESFTLSKRIYCHNIGKLNSSQVAVGTDTNHVKLVDLRSGSSTHELRGHKNSVLAVQVSKFSLK